MSLRPCVQTPELIMKSAGVSERARRSNSQSQPLPDTIGALCGTVDMLNHSSRFIFYQNHHDATCKVFGTFVSQLDAVIIAILLLFAVPGAHAAHKSQLDPMWGLVPGGPYVGSQVDPM